MKKFLIAVLILFSFNSFSQKNNKKTVYKKKASRKTIATIGKI